MTDLEVYVCAVEFTGRNPSFTLGNGQMKLATVTLKSTRGGLGVGAEIPESIVIQVPIEKGREFLELMDKGTIFRMEIGARVGAA